MTRATFVMALLPMTAFAQYSTAKEEALGQQLAQGLERSSTLLIDSTVTQYVNRIAQKLAQAASLPAPLSVKVITGDNSYAFPGASYYVSTKLTLTAASEAELAGAIGHLMGHVALWHDSHAARLDPQNIGQIPIVWAADCLRLSEGGFAIPIGVAERQVALESRADQLGLGYLDKAGYDPGALADLFERILSQTARKPSAFQPWLKFPAATRTRADALRDQPRDNIVTTSEFRDIQQRLEAVLTTAAPAEGRPTLNSRMRVVPELEHRERMIEDPAIVDYLNRISQKLSASASLKVPLTVKVIGGDDPRAVTLPEGITYLTTQLIRTAASESELAGAIAHQLGHLAEAQGKVAKPNGLCERAQGAMTIAQDAETQADLLGLDYMDNAGYDPGALADFYQRIVEPFPASIRIRADALGNGRTSVVDTSDFRAFQQRLTIVAR
jgi:predicted Zn-dependent protease